MGRIQTNIGLISGIPIQDTVDKLMELSARPRDMLAERTAELQAEQVAITELTALLVSVDVAATNLAREDIYDKRKATSSDEEVLTASVDGKPPMGSYQFTPLRTVQSQQLISSGFKSDTEPLGDGKLTFRFGDDVQRSAELEWFSGGTGIERGTIRITDRSGATSEIDLSAVLSVDDVLEAINSNRAIGVTAVAHGDGIRLIDTTGQTDSNLIVREVGGRTAASLGLDVIDAAADVVDGRDVLWLFDDLSVDELNDGSGVRTHAWLAEIEFRLREQGPDVEDDDWYKIDFSTIEKGSSNVLEEATLGEILAVINAAAPGKLVATIAPDGSNLVLADETHGDGSFEIAAANDQETLGDLGFTATESAEGPIIGRRIFGGAGTVLLSSLGGGRGLGELGSLELTDRSGHPEVADLSNAETLDEVIDAINAIEELGITARVNRARNGIELIDTTGLSDGPLIVASGDSTETAEKLGIAVDADVTQINGGDLHLQVIAENTLLDDLDGGAGVARGTMTIFDANGRQAELTVDAADGDTVGDVIDQINKLVDTVSKKSLEIHAEINANGDGILLRSTAGDSAGFHVDEGNSSTAADLRLLGFSTEAELDGAATQVIDGSTTHTLEFSRLTVATLLADLNGGNGVAAGSFTLINSNGDTALVDLSGENIRTVGDVIGAVEQLNAGVRAEINQTGDGLRLIDQVGGEDELQVLEGSETTAADLKLLGAAQQTRVDDADALVIDGAGVFDGIDSLEDLRQAVNASGAGVTATTFLDGSSKPHRLSLVSDRSGTAGRLVVDTSEAGFSMQQTVRARDALLVFGEPDMVAASVLVSSSSNTFSGVLADVTLQVKRASDVPVTVTVEASDADLSATVQTMVDNYNNFRGKLEEYTKFDPETETGGILTGDSTALRLDIELSGLFSGRFGSDGPYAALSQLGVDFNEDGTLGYHAGRLKTKFAADPDTVQRFFADENFGVATRLGDLLDQLTGIDNSLLTNRADTLAARIDDNHQRIGFLNDRLDQKRELLYLDFYRMELAIGKLQNGLAAIESIQRISPLVSV